MQDLVIIGTGVFAAEMAYHLDKINEMEEPTWNLLGYISENVTGEFAGYPVLGNLEDFLKMDRKILFFVAELDSHVRETVAKRCKEAGFTGATIVGFRVRREENTHIGEGTFIEHKSALYDNSTVGDFCIIAQAFTARDNAHIGDFVTLELGCVIGEDAHIGKHCRFGLRCTADDGVRITENCSFATGTCIHEDILVSGAYTGNPVRPVEK